jgi:hypothetical protein
MKNQSATAGSGIQALLDAFETNAPITQSPHDFNEVSQRATQAIEFPHHQDVTLPGVVQGFIQSRSYGFRATGNIGKDFLFVTTCLD